MIFACSFFIILDSAVWLNVEKNMVDKVYKVDKNDKNECTENLI